MALSDTLLGLLGGAIKDVGKNQIVELLDKLHAKDEAGYMSTVLGLYPLVDSKLETLAAESKNKVDDSIVGALKEGIEISAAKYGVQLPNTDND